MNDGNGQNLTYGGCKLIFCLDARIISTENVFMANVLLILLKSDWVNTKMQFVKEI